MANSEKISGSRIGRIFFLSAIGLGVQLASGVKAQDASSGGRSEIQGVFSEELSTPAGGITNAMMRTIAPGDDKIGVPVHVEGNRVLPQTSARSFQRSAEHEGPADDVVFSPTGEAIEVFNPLVDPERKGQRHRYDSDGNWDVAGGDVDLRRKIHQSKLWAPQESTGGGWADGPLGLQVAADLLHFSRAIAGGGTFATNDSGQSFSVSDIEIDPKSAVRYRLAIASEYGTGYEFVGYDFDEFSGALSLEGEGITPVFFGGVPSEPVDAYTATYQSRIKNYEFNIWARRTESLRVGYGLRHFSIEENFDITQAESSGSTTPTMGGGAVGGVPESVGFFSATDNNLFGGQIMVELFRRISTGTYLQGGVKGMLLNNRADLDVNTENIDMSGEDSFITGGVNFHGGLSYRPFRGVNLRAGYEGVFIGSVASGLSQSENNSLFDGSISPVGEGLYYGGGYFGCAITF